MFGYLKKKLINQTQTWFGKLLEEKETNYGINPFTVI